ncbi:NmrA family NAD(P)-binding protein [Nocardia macrotermitis]|uniref:Quinone oxidoreductase 2 n=1 Tax=Nocardia macrotermitis TaxID=2585198 RepID=A0A7K0DEY6_9NOCA|nr:NAD(P)H-binding protein [Nocardia macrotermitis]MQY24091.1 Quinone oxidoreductase 2 [Nocardia macrotermitis]
MIIVTGATGQLGGRIVERLLTRVPAERIGVTARDPGRAQHFADRGIRVRPADFADPASLPHAFEGAAQVLVVSVDGLGEQAVRAHRTAIDGAVAAGAQRVLYTSHAGANPDSHFQPCRDHAATEEILRTCGVPYTALRNGFYITSALYWFAHAASSGSVAVPADGPVAWTAHDDLAEAIAAILAGETTFDGPTPPLTAARAATFTDLAAHTSSLLNRDIDRITVPDNEFRDQLTSSGLPAELADLFLGMFTAARAGEFATVDPTLEKLIGRAPMDLDAMVRDQLAAQA